MTTAFRGGLTHTAGSDPAIISAAKVVGVNHVNWTVDVYTTFDKHRYMDVPVGCPYAHYADGEGIFAMPEIGAKCLVAIPGDTSGPVILTFTMASETPDSGVPTFAGGRPNAKPGDIMMRTRDGNFITLHRGGVVQIGATEVAQRIYIPVGNYITDISQNYNHFNAAGSIVWGVQEGPADDSIPARHTQTFRIHANDKYCDLRVSTGKVLDPIPEPTNKIIRGELGKLGFGEEPVVYEVVLAPGGFQDRNGAAVDGNTKDLVKFKYFFDRAGNTFIRSEGSVLAVFQKDVVIYARKGITMHCEKGFGLNVKQDLVLESKGYTHLKGNLIKLGAGARPVACQGDAVMVTLPVAQMTGVVAGAPFTGVMTMLAPVFGQIMSGSSQVLA